MIGYYTSLLLDDFGLRRQDNIEKKITHLSFPSFFLSSIIDHCLSIHRICWDGSACGGEIRLVVSVDQSVGPRHNEL
jgi:hypothetical protein